MVERVVRDFGDVIEGRKTWKDLLMGFVAEAGASGGQGKFWAGSWSGKFGEDERGERDRDRDREIDERGESSRSGGMRRRRDRHRERDY